MELQSRLPELRAAGLGLVAISYDAVPVLADFAARRGITFPLLSDKGSATIRRFGLLNTTVPETNALFGYPHPGTFIVDRRGVVTSRVFEQAYQERTTIRAVMVRLGARVDVPATRVSAPHLDVTLYATDQIAAPGTHLSLVLDIEAAPTVHVYAPGVVGYRPIALVIDPQPGLLVRSTLYPASTDYVFEPLQEHVPVFQGRFRIVQDVALDASREGEAVLKTMATMTVAGRLDYQACDDRECFNPQSVALKWTLAVKPLDRERAK